MVRAPVYLLGDLKYISALCTLFNGKRFIPLLSPATTSLYLCSVLSESTGNVISHVLANHNLCSRDWLSNWKCIVQLCWNQIFNYILETFWIFILELKRGLICTVYKSVLIKGRHPSCSSSHVGLKQTALRTVPFELFHLEVFHFTRQLLVPDTSVKPILRSCGSVSATSSGNYYRRMQRCDLICILQPISLRI